MWKCPICETNNDEQRRSCNVCGHARSEGGDPTVIPEPDVKREPARAGGPEPERHASPDSAYSSMPAGNSHEEVVKTDSAALWNNKGPNRAAMIIAALGVLALAAAAIWYFTRPSAPLEVRIDVENADRIDGVWYVDDIINITWTSTRDDAVYNVALLDGNGETLRYYENTAMDEMNISRDIVADGDNYALRVTAVDGKDTAEAEIKIAAWRMVEAADIEESAETAAAAEEVSNIEESDETEEETVTEAFATDWVVKFEDENLAQAIRDTIGIEGDITYGDLQELTVLDASRSGIRNLGGIEYCTNLTELYLGNNQISDISPLAESSGLTELYLSSNQISDISPLAELNELNTLYLGANQISDLTPLAGLCELTELYLGNNQISDISPLAELSGLTALGLGSNQVSDVSPLAGLTSLEKLFINEDEIGNMETISHLDCEIY